MNDAESSDFPIIILILVVLILGIGFTGFLWHRANVAQQRAFLERALAAEQAVE